MTDRPIVPGDPLVAEAAVYGAGGLPLDHAHRPTDAERAMQDEGVGGVIPPAGRGEDVARDAAMHELEMGQSRPLTGDEKDAAKHDRPRPTHVEQDTPSRS